MWQSQLHVLPSHVYIAWKPKLWSVKKICPSKFSFALSRSCLRVSAGHRGVCVRGAVGTKWSCCWSGLLLPSRRAVSETAVPGCASGGLRPPRSLEGARVRLPWSCSLQLFYAALARVVWAALLNRERYQHHWMVWGFCLVCVKYFIILSHNEHWNTLR